MDDVCVVTTTIDSADAAAAMAASLVEQRLAACAQVVGGVRSTYRWRGAVERADEVFVVCKTTAALADAVVRAIVELHPYDVPEVLVTPVTGGNPAYLSWVRDEVLRSAP